MFSVARARGSQSHSEVTHHMFIVKGGATNANGHSPDDASVQRTNAVEGASRLETARLPGRSFESRMRECTEMMGSTRKIKAIQLMRVHYVVNDRRIEIAVPSAKLYLVPLSSRPISVKYACTCYDARTSEADARKG